LQFAAALRLEAGWPLTDTLQSMSGDTKPPLGELYRLLHVYWKSVTGETSACKADLTVRQSGWIQTLFAHGGAGLIRPDDGSAAVYFLVRDYRGEAGELTNGLRVYYELAGGYDRKKNEKSLKAIRIRQIHGIKPAK
jgi:cold shock CspA family protein